MMRALHQAALPLCWCVLSLGAAGAAVLGHPLPEWYGYSLTALTGLFVGHRIGGERQTDRRPSRD